jgi:hypothetical protein
VPGSGEKDLRQMNRWTDRQTQNTKTQRGAIRLFCLSRCGPNFCIHSYTCKHTCHFCGVGSRGQGCKRGRAGLNERTGVRGGLLQRCVGTQVSVVCVCLHVAMGGNVCTWRRCTQLPSAVCRETVCPQLPMCVCVCVYMCTCVRLCGNLNSW